MGETVVVETVRTFEHEGQTGTISLDMGVAERKGDYTEEHLEFPV